MNKYFKNQIKWEKKGLIIKPNKNYWWMQSHVMNPTPVLYKKKYIKLYFAGRDNLNRSQTGYYILDPTNDFKILKTSKNPIINLGKLGTFDDNGITPISFVNYKNSRYFFYVGFKPGGTTRTDLFGGLAISNGLDSDSFKKVSQSPILERNKINPYMNTAPFVIRFKNKWHMYYVGGVEWVHKDLPRYNIQYAYSKNGINWIREGKVIINFKNKFEHAVAKPWIYNDKNVLKMWFSYKGENKSPKEYRIGYAESFDGIKWKRKDDFSTISVSKNDFDNEMVCYATTIKFKNRWIMFYNGNQYGKYGAGIAIQKN